jgi:hypothetical protein
MKVGAERNPCDEENMATYDRAMLNRVKLSVDVSNALQRGPIRDTASTIGVWRPSPHDCNKGPVDS